MSDTAILQHSKLSCTMQWTMKARVQQNFIMIVCWIFLISLLRRLIIIFFNLKNRIRAHVRHSDFATLQIELYHVVDYESKGSTKFHNDCILDFFNFTFKTSYDNIFVMFKIVFGPMFDTVILHHPKLNCTVQ